MNRELTEEEKKRVEDLRKDILENMDEAVELIEKYFNARRGVKGADNLFPNGAKSVAARAGKLLSMGEAANVGNREKTDIAVNSFVSGLSFGIYLGEIGLASFFQEQPKK